MGTIGFVVKIKNAFVFIKVRFAVLYYKTVSGLVFGKVRIAVENSTEKMVFLL